MLLVANKTILLGKPGTGSGTTGTTKDATVAIDPKYVTKEELASLRDPLGKGRIGNDGVSRFDTNAVDAAAAASGDPAAYYESKRIFKF